MLNLIKKTSYTLALIATTTSAFAADSVDVKVIGTISPAACTPTLSGGGTVDYGTIKANTLAVDAYTVLDEKTLDFTITCDAPAKVAIKAVNGRPGTAVSAESEGVGGAARSPVTLFGDSATFSAGLGLDGTTKIGGYGLRIQDGVTADGSAVGRIFRGTGSWADNPTGDFYGSSAVRQLSWAPGSSTDPVAFKTLAGKLGVQAYLNKASELDLTKEIQLDGLSTIEIVYL